MKEVENSVPDENVMGVFRTTQSYRDALAEINLKKERREAAKNRIELFRSYEAKKDQLGKRELEIAKELKVAKDALKKAQSKSSEFLRAHIGERTAFDREVSQIDDFLKKTANRAILERIEDLKKYREDFRAGHTIDGKVVRFINNKIVLSAQFSPDDLSERERGIKWIDSEMGRLEGLILSADDYDDYEEVIPI